VEYKPISYCFEGKSELSKEDINIRGWVHRLRKQKDNIFITLRDSTGFIQCILPRTEKYEKVTIESSVELAGKVVSDGRSPGGYELRCNSMNIVGLAEDYPIRKDFSIEFLNDVRHLWNRSRKMQNIYKVRHEVLKCAREWFDMSDWYEVSPPILNKSACEGGSTLFEVDYFKDKAFLSQSAQLYLEAMIYTLENVWSLTPSFRAEKSRTPRHLAEYWHLEGEKAWTDFDEILKIEENLISYIVNNVVERRYKELEALGRNPNDLKKINVPFDRIPYADVIKFLQKKGKGIKFGDDLGTDEERLLTINKDKPIFIYGCPKNIKPFYTKIDPDDERMVLSADMIAPQGFGEISTGGQREENLKTIIDRIKEEEFSLNDYSWYLDLRKYGSVPHSGFGFGIERLLRWICNLEHIRDTIPFPRTMNRAFP
jgi:asparaginyl-tRNA synthetase